MRHCGHHLATTPHDALRAMIDLRSDLLKPCSLDVARAMHAAALRAPALLPGEDPDERALMDALCDELGVEAVLLTPTCTMANQIALRLTLPAGGVVASSELAHVVTVEASATALSKVTTVTLRVKLSSKCSAASRLGHCGREARRAGVRLVTVHPRPWHTDASVQRDALP